MSEASATAPGKVILFGEHAVVYGQPALAVPVADVSARATIQPVLPGDGITIDAVTLGETFSLAERPDSALSRMVTITLAYLGQALSDAAITVESTIPVAAGMGSGAAVSAAIGRALGQYFDTPLSDEELSKLVYEVEKLHHGTPSGIDNTVICHGKPVFFIRGTAPELLKVGADFHLIIADTGVPSATRTMVDGVRERHQSGAILYDHMFDAIGALVRDAREAIESGTITELGPLMNQNHALLHDIGVTSAELNQLVDAALSAGAGGAKMSGGGGGGNMIALVDPNKVDAVQSALAHAGAVRTIHTIVRKTGI
jgi:mevalonate kinase